MGLLPATFTHALDAVEDALQQRPPPGRVTLVAGKGRGVVASRAIAAGERIELAPVVVVPAAHIDGTALEHYVYDWPYGSSDVAVALGNGSLYNHSYTPNAIYVKHLDERLIEYRALRDIEAGEEILVNYNGTPDDRTPLWFDVVG